MGRPTTTPASRTALASRSPRRVPASSLRSELPQDRLDFVEVLQQRLPIFLPHQHADLAKQRIRVRTGPAFLPLSHRAAQTLEAHPLTERRAEDQLVEPFRPIGRQPAVEAPQPGALS